MDLEEETGREGEENEPTVRGKGQEKRKWGKKKTMRKLSGWGRRRGKGQKKK